MNEIIMKNLEQILKNGQIYDGNLARMKSFLNKAKNGEELTVAFIGGSITQGCHADTVAGQYVHRVFDYMQSKYPNAKLKFLCAPVGATDSQYGVARIYKQILKYEPDFLLVEFAVNDWGNDFYKETYEGLIRRILSADKVPALLGLMNVMYNEEGDNAQKQHLEVLRYYQVPAVSMRDSFYAEIENGNMTGPDISGDQVHPNDFGHDMISKLVGAFIDRVDTMDVSTDIENGPLPAAITANHFQNSHWLQNMDLIPEGEGFTVDHRLPSHENDYFVNGWTAAKEGASFKFKVTAKVIAVQYKRYAFSPAPVAKAVIDGNEAEAIMLDAKFDKDWGDCLFLHTLGIYDEAAEHTVEITVPASSKDEADFYLISVIYAD